MLRSVGVGLCRTFITWASGRKLEASNTSKEFALTLVPDLICKEDVATIEYVVAGPLCAYLFVTPPIAA